MLEVSLALLPTSVLILAALVLFLGGTCAACRTTWGYVTLAAFLVAAVLHYFQPQMVSANALSSGQAQVIVLDEISRLSQGLALIVGALFVAMSLRHQVDDESAPEFFGLVLTMFAGWMIVVSANDLILLFLGLELVSIPTYILIYLGRRDARCQEAAAKYFLLSVLSAAVLLYGFSFVYGITGSTNLTIVRAVLQETYTVANATGPVAYPSKLGIVALVLIFAGLGFKLAAVPFHFYAPDVYQGTNSWNAGVLSVVPKAAGLVALVRVASHTLVGYEGAGQTIALILALVTMTGGNVLALVQTNVRRMLAYSGVAHAGYMLVGIAVGFWDQNNPSFRLDPSFGLPIGVQATFLYLIAYSIVTVGLFGVLVYLARGDKEIEHIEDLTGLWKSNPWLAISAAIFLFSLAGIPPFPGFWGKLALFGGALSVRGDLAAPIPYPNPSFVVLAVVGMLNAAVAAVYYLRLIALMFLHDPMSTPQPRGGRPGMAVVTFCAVATIVLSFQSGTVLGWLRAIETPGVTEVAESKASRPVSNQIAPATLSRSN